jgi:hypothetical protein
VCPQATVRPSGRVAEGFQVGFWTRPKSIFASGFGAGVGAAAGVEVSVVLAAASFFSAALVARDFLALAMLVGVAVVVVLVADIGSSSVVIGSSPILMDSDQYARNGDISEKVFQVYLARYSDANSSASRTSSSRSARKACGRDRE